ncbi:putative epimerase [Janibacter sp. HTCC2649]|uniref:NAD-dependent epimerase/dehydratase family protein n=1 Tax=Janibacter sp. HTCC2649 TaxID=313589 RepID=UPI0000671880|nr:NAD-dependent epimerase/dehydratase family protein [Janibacter sp. HTCC2649]EAP98235.1 putative epimerase [Janibacter sp. HTCC2649]
MRIVVTGGAGFIGGAVVRALLEESHDVVVLDSLRPDVHRDGGDAARARLGAQGVRIVEGDVRDVTLVRQHVHGADAVVHLAAKVGLGVDLDDMDDYVSCNAVGTAMVLRACHDAGVTRLVQASSMVVYGEGAYECEEHGPVAPPPRDEQRLAAGLFEPDCPHCGADLVPHLVAEDAVMDPRNTYAATKVTQEQLAAVWARETGASATSLRLHNVYGPGMPRSTPYAGVAAIFWSASTSGQPPQVFEDGGQRRDFVHVDDIASAFVAAVQSEGASGAAGEHTAYNVGSGVVHTVGDLATELALLAGGPSPVVTGRYRLGDVRHITASSDRARRELGWTATVPFTQGLSGLSFS